MQPALSLALIAAVVISLSATAGKMRSAELAEKAQVEAQAQQSHKPVMQAPLPTLSTVTAEDVQVMIDRVKPLVIIDARAKEDFDAGHIPGAFHLRASEATAEKLAAIAPAKEANLVFYCANRHSPASAKAAYRAAQAGYTRLFRYKAGIDDWRSRGMPVVEENPTADSH